MFLIIASAVSFVIIVRSSVRGRMADGIVQFFQTAFRINYSSAVNIYQNLIRNNIEAYTIAAIVICFFVLSRSLILRFSAYFNEINEGVDALITGEGREILLSPELDFMEQKLGSLQRTLEIRAYEAQQADQRKNDLVMYLAHDIKTPLTSVIGYLSLLDEAPDMPPEQKAKYVNITLDKANRLEKLVDEFFEITRYSFHAAPLAKEDIDLYYMLAQMIDEFYPLLAAKGKQAVLHVPEDMTVYGDPDMLARVFNNVLKNAAAYSPDQSVIEITASITDVAASVAFI
jgi:two-component system sensor histidine kinase VanS